MSHPNCFTPGKTQYPLYRRLGGPQGQSGQMWKISPPPGFEPWIIQQIASRYTKWAIPDCLKDHSAFFFKDHIVKGEWLRYGDRWKCLRSTHPTMVLYPRSLEFCQIIFWFVLSRKCPYRMPKLFCSMSPGNFTYRDLEEAEKLGEDLACYLVKDGALDIMNEARKQNESTAS